MSLNKRTKKIDEIDISKLIFTIVNNKLKISLFVILSILIFFVYHQTLPPKKAFYRVKTEIRPISTFDEVKYVLYNSFINRINLQKSLGGKNNTNFDSNFPSYINIDKKKLLDLFTEEIIKEIDIDDTKQNSLFKTGIKKYKIIKIEDFKNIDDYEDEVLKLAASVQINTDLDQNIYRYIHLNVYNKKNISKLLDFIEKSINKKIQENLELTFKSQIITQKKLREYEIESVKIEKNNAKKRYDTLNKIIIDQDNRENQLNLVESFNVLNNLELKEKFLSSNTDIKTFENIIAASPIRKPEVFYAAKLVITKISTKGSDKGPSVLAKLVMAGLFGFILGIFYIMISNSIMRRG